jgi:hypothetical protein
MENTRLLLFLYLSLMRTFISSALPRSSGAYMA